MLLVVAAALGCRAPAVPPVARHRPTRVAPQPAPRLVVLLVVDQLPSWSFEARAPFARHGLRRLIDGGLVFARVRFPFAATLTAAGHAALVSGAAPAQSGVVANRLLDRERDVLVPVTFDPDYPVLGREGGGVSPRALRVATVGDAVRARGGQVIGISCKDRSAVLLGGQRATLALWYDAALGRMTSSRYYVRALPGWVTALRPLQQRLPFGWRALDGGLLTRWAGVDDNPDEPADHPLGRAFPRELVWGPGAGKLAEETPLADEMTLEAAIGAIDALATGRGAAADLLAVSFSAHDKVGHSWGQQSWESWDVFLRLDRLLGRLLAHLDRRYGPERYAVLLTSDHGVARGANGAAPGKVDAETIELTAERAAAALLGPGDWVAAVDVPYLYLSRSARALAPARREALVSRLAERVAALPGLAFAAPSAEVSGDCAGRRGVAAAQCRAVYPGISGELLLGARARVFIADAPLQTTSHGSLNDDDALVPLLLVRPGTAPGRHDTEVSALRVAATLADLLGVPAPAAAAEASLLP